MKNFTLKATLVATFTVFMGTVTYAENQGCDNHDMYSHQKSNYSHSGYKDAKSYEYKNSKNHGSKYGYEKYGYEKSEGHNQYADRKDNSSPSYGSGYDNDKSYSGGY